MKPHFLLMAIVLGLAGCAEASTETSRPAPPATTSLQPVAAQLAGLNIEVHAQPG